ncbi:MAG TPA: VWA domain-containing protein [Gaiellaceae bacterium]|nr:VWA domain-containing protein [Gaiellaceae bacterium]
MQGESGHPISDLAAEALADARQATSRLRCRCSGVTSCTMLHNLPRWLKSLFKIIGVAVVTAAVAVPITVYETRAVSPTTRHVTFTLDNTEIVLDTSAKMSAPFDGRTKLSIAARMIDKYIGDRNKDDLAFRTFGGPCKPGTRLLIDFATGNAQRISESVARQQAAGASALASAIIGAAGDFENVSLIPTSLNAEIVVVTGGADDCDPSSEADVKLRLQELKGRHIVLEFWIIGVDVSTPDRAQISSFASAVGGHASFPKNPDQLSGALQAALVVAPVARASKQATSIWPTTAEQLKVFIATVGGKDYGATKASLSKLLSLAKSSGKTIGVLYTASVAKRFPAVSRAAASVRRSQANVLSLAIRATALDRMASRGSKPAARALRLALAKLMTGYDDYLTKANTFSLTSARLLPQGK